MDGWFVCVCVRACAWGQPCLMYTSTLVLDYWIVSVVAPEQATAHVTPLLSGDSHSTLAVVATSVTLLVATIQ